MNKLVDWMTAWMIKVQQKSFYYVLRKTVIILFPFVLIGSFAKAVNRGLLVKNGFGGQVLHIYKWLPYCSKLQKFFASLEFLTLGLIAVLAAYQSARYTAKLYGKDDQIAGITGMLSFLLIFSARLSANDLIVTNWLFKMQGVLLGLIVGYVVGQIFRVFGRGRNYKVVEPIMHRSFAAFPPILAAFFVASVGMAIAWAFNRMQLGEMLTDALQNSEGGKHEFLVTTVLTVVNSILGWLGLNGPMPYRSAVNSDAFYDNLESALKHNSAWYVPHKYTDYTLFHSFAYLGGMGCALALVIAIALVSHHHSTNMLGIWSLFPVTFNINGPLLIGLPILMNPLYIIPVILAPLANVLIAGGLIVLKIIPPSVFVVPPGTPGPLISFIGTNGNVGSLIVSLLLLALDVLIYIPFVRVSDGVYDRLEERKRKELKNNGKA